MQASNLLFYLLFNVFFSTQQVLSQISIGSIELENSSILSLESTVQGFLPPRLTSQQRDVINTPATGLLIYNYEAKCIQTFNGIHWFDYCTGSEIIQPFFAAVNEGGSIQLQVPEGYVFSEVLFASYGTPTGSNGNYQLGSCHAVNSKSIIENQAIGANSFSINATNAVFGDPCNGTFKRLYLLIAYSPINQ
jgi:hypothetical protein